MMLFPPVAMQALPLLLAALYDLRSQSDLALRQAAASTLAGLVEALAAAEAATAGAAGEDPPDSILRLIGRVLYPQVTRTGCHAVSVASLRPYVTGDCARKPALASTQLLLRR